MTADYFELVGIGRDINACVSDTGTSVPETGTSLIDGIYCICARGAEDRFRSTVACLSQIGFQGWVRFYRPPRAEEPAMGCWESHRAVAEDALRRGFSRVLILEDDVLFTRPWSQVLTRLRTALKHVPPDWLALFLGHKPFRGYIVGPNLMRCSSHLTHAYLANQRLLTWLAVTTPGDPTIPSDHPAIDAAFRVMRGFYAIYPMVALQRYFGPNNHPLTGRPRPITDPLRYTAFVNRYLVRPMELFCAIFAGSQKRFFEQRSHADPLYIADTPLSADARLIRRSGLFDDDYYRRTNPDVAMDPLRHFMWDGVHEGRQPNADFDTEDYLRRHPELAETGENPLAHHIRNDTQVNS